MSNANSENSKPNVKGQASDKGGEVPPQDAGPSVPPKPDSKAVSDCPAPPCCAFGYLEVGFVMNGKRQEEKGHVKLYFTESKFSELQESGLLVPRNEIPSPLICQYQDQLTQRQKDVLFSALVEAKVVS